MHIPVIFQDRHLLIVNKPAGLTTDPAMTTKQPTLVDFLQKDFGIKLFRSGIVHRLDKDTSGLLLVAKTQEALENLQAQFKERKIKKEYLALVHGQIMEKGKVEGSIGRNPLNREKFTVLAGAKEAVTEYEPIKNLQFTIYNLQKLFQDFNKIQFRKLYILHYTLYTLVACRPTTGRTHQIRVHLKYIGHPVVADEKYVGRKMYRLDKRWCPRLFLHAARLGFKHPVTGEWTEFESQLPEDLKNTLWTTFLYSWP